MSHCQSTDKEILQKESALTAIIRSHQTSACNRLASCVALCLFSCLAYGDVIYTEDFESGSLGPEWSVTGTRYYTTTVTSMHGPSGGNYHLTMASRIAGRSSRNEATLALELENYEDVVLTFQARDYGDEGNGPPPIPYSTGYDFDGVAISTNGFDWYEVHGLRNELTSTYKEITVDIDAAIAEHGLSYSSPFFIRFNQYDNYPIPIDGIAIDDIAVTGKIADHLKVTPDTNLVSTGYEKGPFDPEHVEITVSNTGTGTLNWYANTTDPWVDIAPAAGTLEPGESKRVALNINENAKFLPWDTTPYASSVTFTNHGTLATRIIDWELTVNQPPPEVERSDEAVTVILEPDSAYTVNLGLGNNALPDHADLSWKLKPQSTGGGSQEIDVIGSPQYNWRGRMRYRGDTYEVKETTKLTKIDAYLNFYGSQQLNYVVFESGSLNGKFVRVYNDSVTVKGSGSRFYSSLPMNVDLVAGKFYIIATGWRGRIDYTGSRGSYNETVSFGKRRNGFYHNRFPIAGSVRNTRTSTQYHQRLTTIGGEWLSATPASGAVSPQSSDSINVDINTKRMSSGFYEGRLDFETNDPEQEEFTIPVRLAVGDVALVDVPLVVRENDGRLGGAGSVSIPHPIGYDLPVTITSNDTSAIEVESSVTIPAGSTFVEFDITVIDDTDSEENQEVTIAVSAPSMKGSWSLLTVEDDDVDHFDWEIIDSPQFRVHEFDVVVRAKDPSRRTVSHFNRTVSLGGYVEREPKPVEILSFTKYADTRSTGEYRNTLAALSNHFTDFNETSTNVTDPTALAVALQGKDVFLIPEQERSHSFNLNSLGQSWKTVLQDFVANGGVVIVCSFYGSEHLILHNSELIDLVKAGSSGSATVTKSEEHPLTRDISDSFPVKWIGRYRTASGISLVNSGAESVVATQKYGEGHVVMVGADFYTIGTDMDRILANAVKLGQNKPRQPVAITPVVSGTFTNGVWSGTVTVNELAEDMFLMADDGGGHSGESNKFDTYRALYVNANDGNDDNNGLTEATAKQTIQSTINSSNDTDWIFAAAGTYFENIVLGGKAITLTSYDPDDDWTVENTIIDGNRTDSVIRCNNGEGPDTVITGFTIRNGFGNTVISSRIIIGGGISCVSSSPTINGNIITNNRGYDGAGIGCANFSAPIILNNLIEKNSATGQGGGILCLLSWPRIIKNDIAENQATGGGGVYVTSAAPLISHNKISSNSALHGSGLSLQHSSSRLSNNLIVDNSGHSNSGPVRLIASSPVITNCTITRNSPKELAANNVMLRAGNNSHPVIANSIIRSDKEGVDAAILVAEDSTVLISYSNIEGGHPGEGNMDTDPGFEDPIAGNYHLADSSACIDAGTNDDHWFMDIDGDPRPFPLRTGIMDIGADEYVEYLSLDVTDINNTASPPPGKHFFMKGSYIKLEAGTDPVGHGRGSRYAPGGWHGTGSVPASGTTQSTGFIQINDDSAITWNWNMEYQLELRTDGSGVITGSSEGWYSAASVVDLTAIAQSRSERFLRWVGHINTNVTDKDISLPMSQRRILTAVFEVPQRRTRSAIDNPIRFVLKLYPGWNSISLPIAPLDNSRISVLGRDVVGWVWGWDSRGFTSGVQTIEALKGYWVYAFDETEILVTGKLPRSSTTDLHTGWNLLGPASHRSAPEAMTSAIVGWDEKNQRYIPSQFLKIGKAYFIDGDSMPSYDRELGVPGGDYDADGLSDVAETVYATDWNDRDSDDDKVLDGREVAAALGPMENYNSDDDGLPDDWEIYYFGNITDFDGNDDSDSDNLTNEYEFQYGTDVSLNPVNPDSDRDEMPDGWELSNGLDPLDPADAVADADNDGLTNVDEFKNNTLANNNDTDDDGLTDGWEVSKSTASFVFDPTKRDSDDDGIDDAQEDGDSDRMPDWWEIEVFGDLDENASDDLDVDNLSNIDEYSNGTLPTVSDTDGDGMTDGWETLYALNPLVNDSNSDPDDDSLSNLTEFEAGTDPTNADTDNDTLSDAEEIAVGTDPTNVDTDNDTLSDAEEINFGTDPLTRELFVHDNPNINLDGLLPFIHGAHGPKNAIQEAISISVTGSKVIVSPGRYYENLDFLGKAVTLTSTYPNNPNIVSATVIDGSRVDSVVAFVNGEGPDSILSGFTIKNGSRPFGAGIRCENSSSPTISNCVIADNNAVTFGGGIYCAGNSDATIEDTIITRNNGDVAAGGVYCNSSSLTIRNCSIFDNSADIGGALYIRESTPTIENTMISANNASNNAGGIYCDIRTSPIIRNCTIFDNSTNGGTGALYLATESSATIVNTVFFGNTRNSFATNEISSANTVAPTITYSLVNAARVNFALDSTNISDGVDPQITVDSETGYLHLKYGSPCIDNGTSTNADTTDFEGEARPFPSGGSVDIGADEYVDTDRDTISDIRELAAGSDPVNSRSLPTSTPDDVTPPIIISGYPQDGDLIATNGEAVEVRYSFGDQQNTVNLNRISLVESFIGNVTTAATITNNTVSYLINDPVHRYYFFLLTISDVGGNIAVIEIGFSVDPTILGTSTSVPGGSFTQPFTVDLTSSGNAVIHYSTDGYPPMVGASNTTSASSPIIGIPINQTTRLQYFAVDTSNNREPTKSTVYLFDVSPDAPSGLTVGFDAVSRGMSLSWNTGEPDNQGHHIYRAVNAQDIAILDASRTASHVPPSKLRVALKAISSYNWFDNDVVLGTTYHYGVTSIGADGSESLISDLISETATVTVGATTVNEAIERSVGWLESNQRFDGLWADKPALQILATSQILTAYSLVDKDGLDVRQALYAVKGLYADNHDSRARQILCLEYYGHNTDKLYNRMVGLGSFNSTSEIAGWGFKSDYHLSAIDTALGTLAQLRHLNVDTSLPISIAQFTPLRTLLNTTEIKSSDNITFSWVPGRKPSIFVSALAYRILSWTDSWAGYEDDWIVSNQNIIAGDELFGSYGNGSVVDTAAVLMWLDISSDERNNARDHLRRQQQPNGSWDNDPYLTGLCLEALAKE